MLALLAWSNPSRAGLLDDVIARFEGEFRGAGAGGEIVHTFVSRGDLPALGGKAIYFERRDGGPEGHVSQQHVFVFGEDADGVYATAHDFLDGPKYFRSDAVPERLRGIAPDALKSLPDGCRIRWSAAGGEFLGEVNRATCDRGRGDIVPGMRLRLAADRYSLTREVDDGPGRTSVVAETLQRQPRVPAKALDLQIEGILKAFEGSYRNRPPSTANSSQEQEIASLYTIARRVDVPALGARVAYMEFRRGGLNGDVELQRMISFGHSPTQRAVLMRSFNFRQGKPYIGGHLDPGKLSTLTVEDLEQLPVGCEHIWNAVNQVLIGSVTRDTCRIFIPSMNQWRHVTLQYMLDGQALFMWEQGFDPEGHFKFGTAAPVRFPRVSSSWP